MAAVVHRDLDAATVEAMPDGVLVAGPGGQVQALNTVGAAILQVSALDALGRDWREVLPLEDAQGRDWWDCIRPYNGLATRTRQPERELKLPDGRPLLVTARFVRDHACGPLTHLVVAFRALTGRAREERDSAELVATVAHELRSPLTSVKGFTATLLSKWERFSDEQKRLMLETVNSDADRLTRLIGELLDVSRIDAGRLELHKQVVDVPDAVRRCIAGRVASGEAADRFVVELAGELPEIWADPDKVHQVIGNVVENAVRHGDGTVTISVAPAGDGVEVTVVDEGEGIAPGAEQRVFTKFWRGATRGGTGLGLFIAHGIVQAHGGTIVADRAPGGGALVRFRLPAGTPFFAASDVADRR
jgi:signal transduction histidine kinase